MTQSGTEREHEFEAPVLPMEFAPHASLLTYYLIVSLVGGPLFPLIFLPLYARYATLRYRLDKEGIRMRRGVLFRREVSLAYRRIQDIHLSSNVIERWFGLGKVRIQTASGGAEAEITVEGLKDIGGLRDFLYDRSRGDDARRAPGGSAGSAQAVGEPGTAAIGRDQDAASDSASGATASADPLAAVLGDLLSEVRGLRADLTGRNDR